MRKDYKLIIFIGILLCISLTVGTSYAYWMITHTQANKNDLATGCFSTTFTEANDISLSNAFPIIDADGKKLTPYTFTITNTCTIAANYQINLEVLNTTTAGSQYIKTELNSDTPALLSSLTTVTKTLDTASTAYEMKTGYLGPSESVTYNLRLWVDEAATTDNMSNKTFSAKIVVITSATETLTLPEILLKNAGGTTAITAKTAPTFATAATTDEGMYAMADDYGTSYYYRGAITNNNVLFGDYCWKVIRINGNGTTRMIYNGTQKDNITGSTTLTQAEYLNLTNDATYAYTYDTGTNQWTSTNHTNSAKGTITFQVGTAGDYMFYYTISSEDDVDKATLYVDNVLKKVFSGSKTSSLLLTGLTTSSVIKVTYTKDSSVASGNDNIIFSLGKNPVVSGKTCANTEAGLGMGTAFNNNYNDNAYVGYMYGTAGSTTYDVTHANTNSSYIKTIIDTWYNTNLSSYADKISDTLFCNDRSIASTAAIWDSTDKAKGYGTNKTYYGAYNRIVKNNSPILSCPNKHDRFTVDDTTIGNGDLTYPVSLITADEVALAGGNSSASNTSYYLYAGSEYWTVSAAVFDDTYASEFGVISNGGLKIRVGYSSLYGVRPVINLNANVIFSQGDGTVTNPFVIS
jgi:hypothetical protein